MHRLSNPVYNCNYKFTENVFKDLFSSFLSSKAKISQVRVVSRVIHTHV